MVANIASGLGAEESGRLFASALERDADRLARQDWKRRWLWAEMLAARGQRKEMSFHAYEGPSHVVKFFDWLRDFAFPDYLPEALTGPLRETSYARDQACAARLGVEISEASLRNMARYNAQDWIFQRFYPVPARQTVQVALDFGAGHGRMANLAFADPVAGLEQYIAVDGIPGTYLTQRAYFTGLGLSLADYLDHSEEGLAERLADRAAQVIHLPTWRLDLVPSGSVDLVCCVQVMKELPRQLAQFVIPEFARVLKPGGALYVRDHPQFHHPNQLPIDTLLSAAGFVLEFSPHLYDRVDIHGIPRIWRRLDPGAFLLNGE